MDGGGGGDGGREAIGSSAGAADRARRTSALDIANALAAAVGEAREDALDHAAYEMGRLVGHGFDRGDAGSLLFGAAGQCGLVAELGVDAVQSAIAGGIREGERSAGEEIKDAAPRTPIVVDGDDDEAIPPRPWLLGWTFCRGFVSAVIAPGATGKTALRIAQLMALASGRPLTSEKVHKRTAVLWISLEDNEDEMRRRVRACRLRHEVSTAELRGWFFRLTLTRSGAKLVVRDENGLMVPGPLAAIIRSVVIERGVGLVSFDPFVKSHTADENDNKAIDEVMQVLVALADDLGIAVDTTHHTRKGAAEAGDADIGRGASAMRDALRLGKTLTVMTKDEAQTFAIPEAERRRYVRYDDAKANLAPAGEAQWFHLASVPLGNATEDYPSGDSVQTVEPWSSPGIWDGISNVLANDMLTAIDAGPGHDERYTDHGNGDRAAWRVVVRLAPDKTDAQARTIVQTWVRNGVLDRRDYTSPSSRRQVKGLFLNHTKRPS